MNSLRCLAAVALAAALAVPAAAGGPGGGLDRIPRAKILESAREIDRLVDADLAAHKVTPNPALDDASFARRVYLDLAGRIPTDKELAAFLASSPADRREALIDKLLESPAYVSRLFNEFADLLRVKSRLQNNISGEPYIHFIKESIAQNKPYDVFVRELLSASGPAHKRGAGATGYYLRDRGMPEDNMSNTITVFLGTRLECAQCHNHPFDTWTQRQYHEMVAFTGGIRYTDDSFPSTPEGQRLKALGDTFKGEGKTKERSPAFREFRKLMQPLEYGISGSGTGLYRLPKDYQYPDAKPNQPVKAHAMWGEAAPLAANPDAVPDNKKTVNAKGKKAPNLKAPDIDSRNVYARWLTSPENPRFTTVIANRMWKSLFGLGVIEPALNLREDTKAANPALMKALEGLMSGMNYDLKQYLRVLANTKAYQREACRQEPSDETPFRFPGPLLRRMSAEQLWDSMLTLVVPDLDATLNEPGEAAESVYRDYERLAGVTEAEAKAAVELEILKTKDPAKFKEARKEQMEAARTAAKADPELEKKIEALQAEMKAARKKGDDATAKRLREELQALEKSGGPLLMQGKKGYKKGGEAKGFLRASDMPQPAPAGHFLREFGQSDREQIEVSHTDSTVPQALSLLNGFVDKTLLPNARAALRQAVTAAPTSAEKVATAFRGVLSRDPSAAERELWTGDLDKRGEAAAKDLIWTLVNTHEFMFIR